MSDKCPFCGAAKGKGELHFLHTSDALVNPVWFECGTIIEPQKRKAPACYEHQIAALRTRLEAAEAKLGLWREFWDRMPSNLSDRAKLKLRELGEIKFTDK